MPDSEDRDFNRLKGSLYIIVGVALIVYALYYFIFPVMRSCPCPEILSGYNPVQSVLPLVYSIFVIFLAMIGVVLVALGHYTAKYGGFAWKRFSLRQKIYPSVF